MSVRFLLHTGTCEQALVTWHCHIILPSAMTHLLCPHTLSSEGRGCVCFPWCHAWGPGTRQVLSHCHEKERTQFSDLTPSRFIFPRKRHKVMVTTLPWQSSQSYIKQKPGSPLGRGQLPSCPRIVTTLLLLLVDKHLWPLPWDTPLLGRIKYILI
jgi:hypothetical protein